MASHRCQPVGTAATAPLHMTMMPYGISVLPPWCSETAFRVSANPTPAGEMVKTFVLARLV
jgi:hypothetical protein